MIPHYDDFIKDIRSIWADGDLSSAYSILPLHVDREQGEQGQIYTYSDLIEAWKLHIRIWNSSYGSRDEKYISKSDREKKKNFHDFLIDKIYLNDETMDKGEQKRDEYLFPQWLTVSELSDMFKKITKKVELQRKNIIDGIKKTTDK